MSSNYTSNVYVVEPSTIRFDDKYVVFNPVHSELEYEATKENIKRLGQLDPILMLNGLCIDGRHRTRIAEELGEMVRCVDVDGTEEADIILLCNKNVMSGRDYDNSQKAIQALRLVNEHKLTSIAAAKLMKVDKRLVSYAATIRGYGRSDILDRLMEDKSARVQLSNMERPSRSLELLAKFVKSEEEAGKVVVDDSERIRWNADAVIKTELGKAWYYEVMEIVSNDKVALGITLAEMANMKFKIEA